MIVNIISEIIKSPRHQYVSLLDQLEISEASYHEFGINFECNVHKVDISIKRGILDVLRGPELWAAYTTYLI
jgi:hypothetical protein